MNRFSFTPTAQFPLACRVLLGFALAGTAGAQTSPAPVTAEPSEETLHLSPFQVNTTQEKGYAGTHAMGASRFNIALVDVPQSVVVLNQQMLSDVGKGAFVFDPDDYSWRAKATGLVISGRGPAAAMPQRPAVTRVEPAR